MVQGMGLGVVAIHDDDQAVRVGIVMNPAEHPTQGAEEAGNAVGLQVHVDRLRRLTEESFREDHQGRLIGGRFGVAADFHGLTETPPRTPLYHTSLSGASPRIS